MKRERWILGNWKMHGKRACLNDIKLLEKLMKQKSLPMGLSVGLFLPATLLIPVADLLGNSADTLLLLGGQNCHQKDKGPFTGEISPSMLLDASASMVLLGHSESRARGEISTLIASKVASALAVGLRVVLCVGEPLSVREKGETIAFLHEQLHQSLPSGISSRDSIIIAYEPIWSIGTGTLPPLAIVQEVLSQLQTHMRELIKREVPVLYGGSVNEHNVASLCALPEVTGVLVGGASLQCESFWRLIEKVI